MKRARLRGEVAIGYISGSAAVTNIAEQRSARPPPLSRATAGRLPVSSVQCQCQCQCRSPATFQPIPVAGGCSV